MDRSRLDKAPKRLLNERKKMADEGGPLKAIDRTLRCLSIYVGCQRQERRSFVVEHS